MRSWILGAAFIIVGAFNPEVKFETTLSVVIVFLWICGFFMDAIEFFKRYEQY